MSEGKEYWDEVRAQIRRMRQEEQRQAMGREADRLAAAAEGGERAVDAQNAAHAALDELAKATARYERNPTPKNKKAHEAAIRNATAAGQKPKS